jgi:hypothetical protein
MAVLQGKGQLDELMNFSLSSYREAEKKYGSMEDFLRGRLGVTDEDRAAMQEMYLV